MLSAVHFHSQLREFVRSPGTADAKAQSDHRFQTECFFGFFQSHFIISGSIHHLSKAEAVHTFTGWLLGAMTPSSGLQFPKWILMDMRLFSQSLPLSTRDSCPSDVVGRFVIHL
jgi:thiosulfate reductase cytochrome b subunit